MIRVYEGDDNYYIYNPSQKAPPGHRGNQQIVAVRFVFIWMTSSLRQHLISYIYDFYIFIIESKNDKKIQLF